MLPCKPSENPSNPPHSETLERTRLSYDIFDPKNNTFLKAHRAGHFISWTFGLVKRLWKINVDSLCWNSIGNFCSFLIEKSITGQQTPCLFSTIVFLSPLLFYISFSFLNKKHAFSKSLPDSTTHYLSTVCVLKWNGKSLNNYEELDNDERLNANANGTALPEMSDLKLQCKCTYILPHLFHFIHEKCRTVEI